MNKAVFIDKDGTLIPDIPYNADPALITLSDGVCFGLRALQQRGYQLAVISNQPGIALGYFAEQQLAVVENRIKMLLEQEGIFLHGFFCCPHHPEGKVEAYVKACDCRKPLPGLILKAARDLDVDLSASWMIGDILNDVEAGNRAACRTILIDNGNETEWQKGEYRTPNYTAKSVDKAAAYILAHKNLINAQVGAV